MFKFINKFFDFHLIIKSTIFYSYFKNSILESQPGNL